MATQITITQSTSGLTWTSSTLPGQPLAFASQLAGLAPSPTTLAQARIERQTRQRLDTYNRRTAARTADATITTELWASTSAWGGTGIVSGGKMFASTNGLALAISVPAGGRRLYRSVLHAANTGSAFAFFGITCDTAGSAPSGSTSNVFILGTLSSAITLIQGSNLTGPAANTVTGALSNGVDYIATVAIDETGISLSLAPVNGGQTVWCTSIRRSQLPTSGGLVPNLILSCSDGAGGMSWGPVIEVSELTFPPAAAQAPAGQAQFGASNPLVVNRVDPTTGIRHIITVPGTYDPRQPAPVVLFMHEALIGTAADPYLETSWANVLAAFMAAGFILVASDNGTSTSGGGSSDKYGTQAGMDDYSAALDWTRQHFNTGAVFLLGTSQGGEFVQNMLASQTATAVGGVAAAASISPSTDLVAVSNLPTYQAAIWAAWGATSAATFLAAIAGLDPVQQPAYALRGVPQRFYVALDDTTTPKATHVDPMVATLTGTVPECGVVTVATGGHLAPALYQGSDLVAFYSRYL